MLGALFCRTALLLSLAVGIYGAMVIGLKVPAIGWCVLGILMWWRYRHWQRRGGGYAHGTARVADAKDLHSNGLLGQDGLILGRVGYTPRPSFGEALWCLLTLPPWRSDTAVSLALGALFGKKWGRDGIIRVRDFVHLATFAPAGGGKSIYALVPNLLSYARSCVVTDPKGELFGLTGEHRRRKFKHRVARLDPFGLGGPGTDTFNPMDLIDPNSPHLIDQARDLASMLVVRTGKEQEPFWNDMAEAVLATFIAYVAACERTPGFRNLQTVRELVCDRARFTNAIKLVQRSDACGGMLRRLGASLSWLVDRELGGVLTSVQRHTNFLDSPVIAASTARSSFNPRELRARRMTVYLCLPPDKLESLARLQRMWVGSILRAVTADGASERSPVLFLLDEAGNLGHIQALEDAVTLLRGYGVRMWFFFQSVGQLTTCFGDRASILLDNIGTQQFFGINAYESADFISRRLGDTTIQTYSWQKSTSHSHPTSNGGPGQQSGQRSTGSNLTVSEMGRRLLRPEEILCLPGDMAVIFHKNMPPIIGKLLRYFDAPEFKMGGTGQSRRRGFNVLVRSLFLLGLSAIFAAFAVDLPTPPRPPAGTRRVDPYARRQPYGRGSSYGNGRPMPLVPQRYTVNPTRPTRQRRP